MTAALVQTLGSAVSSTTQASISLTLTAPTTAGDTLVASCIQAGGNGFSTVTDSKGNVWTKVRETKVSVGASHTIASFVAQATTALAAGDTITLTSSVSTQYPVLVAYEFSPTSGPADAITSAEDAGTSSSTYSIPGVSIPAGEHLLIGVLGESGAGRSQTPSGTWIKLGANGTAAPTFPRTVMSMWDTAADGGTLAASGTFSGSGRWCGHLLAFPVASASNPPSQGSGTGSHTWTGTGVGRKITAGIAAGVFAFAGAAAGSTVHSGTGAGATVHASTATGSTVHSGIGIGSTTRSSAATGSTGHSGAGTGTTVRTGAGTGHAPAAGQANGSGTGAHTWTGTASGTAIHTGDGSGATTWVSGAAGSHTATGTGAGGWTTTGTAQGVASGYRDIDLTYATAVDRWADSVPGDRWQSATSDTRWVHTTRPDRWTHVTSPDRWE